jgi:hypothetical protein
MSTDRDITTIDQDIRREWLDARKPAKPSRTAIENSSKPFRLGSALDFASVRHALCSNSAA